jgi:hypothetical protein
MSDMWYARLQLIHQFRQKIIKRRINEQFFSSGSEVVVSARIIPGVGTSGGEM